jgi:hypothetical protein
MIEAILIGVTIAAASIILLIILIGSIKALKDKKKAKMNVQEDETQIVVKEEISETVVEAKEAMKVVIAQGESIIVGSEGRIPCGEYTMESCDGEETFNVRIGRYVKEYTNGCKVVLTEKQKVTAVSTSIILR